MTELRELRDGGNGAGDAEDARHTGTTALGQPTCTRAAGAADLC
jgi:hypothetical protein